MLETACPTCVRMCLNLRGQIQNVFVAGWILLRLAHKIGSRCKRQGVGLRPVLEVVLGLLGWLEKLGMAWAARLMSVLALARRWLKVPRYLELSPIRWAIAIE
jgi:hypothetical protein